MHYGLGCAACLEGEVAAAKPLQFVPRNAAFETGGMRRVLDGDCNFAFETGRTLLRRVLDGGCNFAFEAGDTLMRAHAATSSIHRILL